MRVWGKGRDVFGCALIRALAVSAGLPCSLHLMQDTFPVLRL